MIWFLRYLLSGLEPSLLLFKRIEFLLVTCILEKLVGIQWFSQSHSLASYYSFSFDGYFFLRLLKGHFLLKNQGFLVICVQLAL